MQALAHVSDRRHVLVVVERDDTVAWKSLRNVDRVHLLVPDQLNTYDVLVSDDVVFTQGALAAFLEGPRKGKSTKAVATVDRGGRDRARPEPGRPSQDGRAQEAAEPADAVKRREVEDAEKASGRGRRPSAA